jgi:hypothetical protein
MLRFVFLVFIAATPFFRLWGQEKGIIEIHEDNQVVQAVNQYLEYTMKNPGLSGYRIQIFFDSGNRSKQMAMNAKASFQARFPEIEAYLSFEEPNYKVRVGNFRTKLDAERCLRKIFDLYSNAFIVPDHINFPKLDDSATKEEQSAN